MQYFKDTIINKPRIEFNVIGLSEVRLDPNLISLYELPGYNMFANSRNIHGGDVVLYVSDDHNATIVNHLNISEAFIETTGVQANTGKGKYLFLNVYRPPSGRFAYFYDVLSDILSSVYDRKYQSVYNKSH